MHFVSILLAFLGALLPAGESKPAEVTYLANEGFLIRSGKRTVCIDGLFREKKKLYDQIPPKELARLETARPPFDAIDIILVSHYHADHFHPESVREYLVHRTEAILVTSGQVVDKVKKDFPFFDTIKEQVMPMTPEWGQKIPFKSRGVEVQLFRLSHGTGWNQNVENLGHLVRMGGQTFLHLGDAVTDAKSISAFAFEKEKIDVAFIPYWFCLEEKGRQIIAESIQPKTIVPMHIPSGQKNSVAKEITLHYPEAVIFSEPMEKKTFPLEKAVPPRDVPEESGQE